MRRLLPQIDLEPRDAGAWTNQGVGESCLVMLPPLKPATEGVFEFYGIDPHAINIESIERDAVQLGPLVADGVSLSASEAPGGYIAIRNVLGQKWHAMRVPGLGPSPDNGDN